MRIFSYNVNGIRSAINKGFATWLSHANPDIVLLQEIKASHTDVDAFQELGYYAYSFPAEKKGYSGVAILCKQKPDHIEYGCGIPAYDSEGRIIRADFGDTSVMSLYLPSGTTGDVRQAVKYEMMDFFQQYVNDLRTKHPNLIIGGDFNICHTEIDIHNPKSNAKSSGFLPEERAWIGRFIDAGMIDSFRKIHGNKLHQYTWWSFRAGSKDKNLGWRIDYLMAAEPLKDKIIDAAIYPEVVFSDHCPLMIELQD
jgi:exodeoxyribonuclease III